MNKTLQILVLPLFLVACSKEAAQPVSAERPASTIVVGVAASDSGNVYSGEVHARYETVLGFRIGGKIVERLVDAGAQVRKGQVLARLDAADTGLQASAANAQYLLAEEELKRYRELRDKGNRAESRRSASRAGAQSGRLYQPAVGPRWGGVGNDGRSRAGCERRTAGGARGATR